MDFRCSQWRETIHRLRYNWPKHSPTAEAEKMLRLRSTSHHEFQSSRKVMVSPWFFDLVTSSHTMTHPVLLWFQYVLILIESWFGDSMTLDTSLAFNHEKNHRETFLSWDHLAIDTRAPGDRCWWSQCPWIIHGTFHRGNHRDYRTPWDPWDFKAHFHQVFSRIIIHGALGCGSVQWAHPRPSQIFTATSCTGKSWGNNGQQICQSRGQYVYYTPISPMVWAVPAKAQPQFSICGHCMAKRGLRFPPNNWFWHGLGVGCVFLRQNNSNTSSKGYDVWDMRLPQYSCILYLSIYITQLTHVPVRQVTAPVTILRGNQDLVPEPGGYLYRFLPSTHKAIWFNELTSILRNKNLCDQMITEAIWLHVACPCFSVAF